MDEKKYEVSLIELRNGRKKYKVTKQIPRLKVSETKMFNSKKNALQQMNTWLSELSNL